ncbi:hypothetical protein Ccrd_000447 [Cynara cardunculus var. scolymus]|uniref:Uncharacterized protein n=1 Tax=Cynara cardunculus var. scolymus TaxID=59895 RepID=A0A103XV50_CYNCS|nr:hypothetical protein Ccrd_000447 [Cynara cardunculus var. scolymus]
MKQSQIRARADPSSNTKWHHLDSFTSSYIKNTINGRESFWYELHRIIPHLWIPTHISHKEINGNTKWAGGCLRRPSKTTDFRYGIFCKSSSLMMDSGCSPGGGGGGGGPTTVMISS